MPEIENMKRLTDDFFKQADHLISKLKEKQKKICPICKKEIHGYPALSRKDNKTDICSACGVTEALQDFARGNGEELYCKCESPDFQESEAHMQEAGQIVSRSLGVNCTICGLPEQPKEEVED